MKRASYMTPFHVMIASDSKTKSPRFRKSMISPCYFRIHRKKSQFALEAYSEHFVDFTVNPVAPANLAFVDRTVIDGFDIHG